MSGPRRGPFGVEIRRGSWQERLQALLLEERQRDPKRDGAALVVEGRPEAAPLAAALGPHLPEPRTAISASPGLLLLSEHVDQLLEADQATPLLVIAVAGSGSREDGLRAAWRLGPLQDRLWVFIRDVTPDSGLVPTVGEHVRRYLEVIEGLAYSEGPRRSR